MGKKPKPTAQSLNGGPLKELQELYRFMQDNNLQALELERKDLHVKLVRQGRPTVPVPVPVPGFGSPQQPAAPAQPGAPPPSAPLPANAYVIKAPMMGIFYRAASPSSPPFAKEGDAVKAGDVLCLIEAMKVFNDIKSDVDGVLRKVCVENGKSVKVGQDLLIIERK